MLSEWFLRDDDIKSAEFGVKEAFLDTKRRLLGRSDTSFASSDDHNARSNAFFVSSDSHKA